MRRAGLLLLPLASCGGPLLEGGEARPANEPPPGRVAAVFERQACVDAASGAVPVPETRVLLIVPSTGEPVLMEQRPGYDSLLVRNAFHDGGELVFQLISSPDEGETALCEYRIEWPQAAEGRFTSALEFERTTFRGGFRAHGAEAALRCRLARHDGTTSPDLDRRARVGYEKASEAGISAGVTAQQGISWR